MDQDKNYFIERALSDIMKYKDEIGAEISINKEASFEGDFRDFPSGLHKDVADIYRKKGVTRLYSHQCEAVESVLKGENVVVATPTASGKTLVYNSAVLDAVTRDPDSRALYLFPTKALSQDQRAELFALNELSDNKLTLHTYDGDTPQSARKAIRRKAQVVLTNPYMIHSGILPHHTKWMNLFQNLKYVIIDELHVYTGVFGSHLANVLRRLKRICSFYGSEPKFIMSSATISNPDELARKIIEEDVTLITRSGAPRGERYMVFFNPPVKNRQLGIRQSYITVARRISHILLKNSLQILTFANSRLITEVLVKYLKKDNETGVLKEGEIRGYRGGYLPRKRREIERGLKQGDIRGVVTTNALELGIDVGSVDCVVLAGYPGTVSSTLQRIGRAGRRSDKSMGIMISSSSPVNQFIVNHPDYFAEKSPEAGRINPDNLFILMDHIKCGAFELPFTEEESFGNENLGDILEYLSENGVLFQKENKWFWTEEGYPADAVSINRVSSDNFVVVDLTDGERIIAEVDFSSALVTLHDKAIYMLEGDQYVVEKLDYKNRKAFVRKSDSDYYTDAVVYTKISALDVFDNTRSGLCTFFRGDVHVFSQVVGFKKIKFFTNENVGAGDLQLPQQEMHTTAFWVTAGREIFDSIPDMSQSEKTEAVSGVARLLRNVASFILMCDVRDLGVSVEDNITGESINTGSVRKVSGEAGSVIFEPTIYIYDNYPNGIGLAESLYKEPEKLFKGAVSILENCVCACGCPSCAGAPAESKSLLKESSLYILRKMLGEIYS